MSSLSVILRALVPVAFVILLGVFAGRVRLIRPEQSNVLATLALNFCLPALLFGATATMAPGDWSNWRLSLGIALGLLVIFISALIISLAFFRNTLAASSLQALNSAFPNVAFIGVPVFTAVLGKSAMLLVVIGNLIGNLVLVPLTLILLAAGSQTRTGTKLRVIWNSLLDAIRQPLIWAPLAGLFMALTHIPLPVLGQKSLFLIGDATSGVALFATGLILSGQKLSLSLPTILNVGFKNAVQPVAMWLLALLLGITGLEQHEMILLGALPTAPITAMFAVRYKVYAEESGATILFSTICSIVTLGLVIALTR